MNKPARFFAALLLTTFAGIGSSELAAQQPGFTRKMLQDQNLSAPQRHAVQVVAEFAPGAIAALHTHPGEELGYVLEGTLLIQIEGEAPRTVNAGDSFFVPAGRPHDGKNVGAGPAKVLATYIVEIGKPVASPVK